MTFMLFPIVIAAENRSSLLAVVIFLFRNIFYKSLYSEIHSGSDAPLRKVRPISHTCWND